MKVSTRIVSVFGLLAIGCGGASSSGPAIPPPVVPATVPAPPPPPPPPAPTVAKPEIAPEVAVLRRIPVLPQPSPSAEVHQTVGLTTFKLSYSSPGAKGRDVWGALVPAGKPWRAGANRATRLSFDQEITFGGAKVPAGEYSIFMVPEGENFTVMLNRDPDVRGVFAYKAEDDVAKISVPAVATAHRERLTYTFDNTTNGSTELTLDWAKKRVAVPITIDTEAQAKASIDDTVDLAWRPLYNAGRYYLDAKKFDEAGKLLEKSVAIKAGWANHWFAAVAFHELGQHKKARVHAESSKALGKDNATFKRAFAKRVDDALTNWPKE